MALDISGKNYLSWILDVELHLDAMGLGDAIKEANTTSKQDKVKGMIFLRQHLNKELKSEYLTVKDPLVLWNNLKERYDHQKTVSLPTARFDWLNLRFQDFRSVSEYNSALFKITFWLKLCRENIGDADLLAKTFSTFHAKDLLLQQQYRTKGFARYSDLLSCLLVAKQNNELLMKNHEARLTASALFPEANASQSDHRKRHMHNRGLDRRRGQYAHRGGRSNYSTPYQKGHSSENKSGHNHKNNDACLHCGMRGHWARSCRFRRHFADLC